MPQARPGGLTQISLRHDTQTDTNAGVLLEKQLVLFCPNIGLLSTCVLSLIPLLRPFTWQSLLLPVLPDKLLSFLEAPVPFVIGVQVSSWFSICCNTLPRLLCVPSWLQAAVPFVVELLVYDSADVEYVRSPGLLSVHVIKMYAVLVQVCICIQQHVGTATLCWR